MSALQKRMLGFFVLTFWELKEWAKGSFKMDHNKPIYGELGWYLVTL
jgi:hypothetical protein